MRAGGDPLISVRPILQAMLAQCHVDTIAFTECFLLPRKSKQAVGSVGKVCMTQDRPGEGNSRDFYKPRGNM